MNTAAHPADHRPAADAPAPKYEAGLDGVRGLAVVAVLAFHSDLPWASGGYLGVSAFFTLSGFLITTLVIARHQGHGIDLADFWSRRARRLLPVAFVGILVSALYAVVAADAQSLERFAGDAVAAVAGVANWRFVFSEVSYADLFSGESPLQHYWSLAIEQQFYLVFPIIAAWALRARTGDRPDAGLRRLRTVAIVGLVGSLALSSIVGSDRAYYGTDTRMAELLVGVVLAIALRRRPVHDRLSVKRQTAVGIPALGAIIGLWSVVDQSSAWLHPWILLLHSALTAVVLAVAVGDGMVARLLSHPVLTTLGRLSYSLYVLHWPVFLWLTADRAGVDGTALVLLRLVVTFAVTVPVHLLVEDPARRRHELGGRRLTRIVLVGAVATLIASTVPVALIDRAPAIDFAAAEVLQSQVLGRASTASAGRVESLRDDADADAGDAGADLPSTSVVERRTQDPSHSTRDGAPTTTRLADTPVVSVFGDSTALLLLPGLDEIANRTGDYVLGGGYATKGCGISRAGSLSEALGVGTASAPPCAFDEYWPPVLASASPDVAVVSIGLWDLIDRRLPGEQIVRALGDPVFDEHLRSEMEAATDLLLETADRVVWLLQPAPVQGTRDANDPVHERLPRLNRIIAGLADGDRVGLVDLPAWLSSTSDGIDSLRLRPDGTHFSAETSIEAATWLGPAILRAAETGERVGPGLSVG